VATATYKAVCERWPDDSLTLKQGSRVIADSRRTRLAWLVRGRFVEPTPPRSVMNSRRC